MMGKWEEEEEPDTRRRAYIRREPERHCDMRAEEERVSGAAEMRGLTGLKWSGKLSASWANTCGPGPCWGL